MKPAERSALLQTLQERFARHMHRHPAWAWPEVQERLTARPAALKALLAMEASGGEPDLVAPEDAGIASCFIDCAAESPAGRRSLCYDAAARLSRKEHAPSNSAVESAASMGIELLDEAQYRALQRLGNFDTKTSSWIRTPAEIRQLGGALFCDRRYGQVFTYHNGAQSYYGVRGFRGALSF